MCIFCDTQSTLKQYQKQITTVIKEKEQVRTDLAKSVLSRSRLESLCRELQRQNREVKVLFYIFFWIYKFE